MSHLISQIKVTNFKSIIQEEFVFSSYTPLVGYNNAGKSNILAAVKWLLQKTSLSTTDFNNCELPVTIEGTIVGITEELLNSMNLTHRRSIESYIENGTIKVKRVQNLPGDSITNIKLDVYSQSSDSWASNPNGIDNAIKALFPDPIQVGAMENSEEDVSKSRAGTTIGKLLAEIISPIEAQYGAGVQTALDSVRNLLDADGKTRAEELMAFDQQVNDKIYNFFPGVNIKIHVPTPDLKEVFNKGTIKVYEEAVLGGKDVSSLGHGAQRSIQMALIQHLAEIKKSSQESPATTLLLVDEPELYLHPQAIEIVRDALMKLSNDGYQIIFSTHSPMMITSNDIGNTVLIRKNDERGTYARKTLRAAVSSIEASNPSQVELLFSLSNSSQILFSEKVVLVEGTTEERILPVIIENFTNKTLGLHKYALVPLRGGGNTKKSMDILRIMDLPAKAIVDFDYVFTSAVKDKVLDEGDTDINACLECLKNIAANNNISLSSNGLPKKNETVSAQKAYAILASQTEVLENIESLHKKMLVKNIWFWMKGAIEEPLGLDQKNEKIWANFCERLKVESLDSVIVDPQEIRRCIEWLTQD